MVAKTTPALRQCVVVDGFGSYREDIPCHSQSNKEEKLEPFCRFLARYVKSLKLPQHLWADKQNCPKTSARLIHLSCYRSSMKGSGQG